MIQAVAARDPKRAAAYARKHGIPDVKASYQELLDDPAIDAVYVPLPNGLHFEWALRALRAGKHVLLEKPSVSNADEAERLLRAPQLLSAPAPAPEEPVRPAPPVLLEAFHYRFQPAWQYFLTLLDRPHLASLDITMAAPALMMPPDDIRFRYDLAGGALMDFGTYAVSAVRQVFAAEPEAVVRADFRAMPPPAAPQTTEYAFAVAWRMPGGATAAVDGNLRAPLREAVGKAAPRLVATHAPVAVADPSLPAGQEKLRTRRLTFANWMVAAFWHRIDVEDDFVVREVGDGGRILKSWTVKESKKAYTYAEAGLDGPGEPYWTSYRHQLEQFVNRVRGRETPVWVDLEDSIAQMQAIDDVYRKAGYPLRPTSKYQ